MKQSKDCKKIEVKKPFYKVNKRKQKANEEHLTYLLKEVPGFPSKR